MSRWRAQGLRVGLSGRCLRPDLDLDDGCSDGQDQRPWQEAMTPTRYGQRVPEGMDAESRSRRSGSGRSAPVENLDAGIAPWRSHRAWRA